MILKNVNQLKRGDKWNVRRFSDDQIAGKLLTMGVLPNSKIEVIRVAPFKGGYYLKVDGKGLAIRENEAANIILEIVNK